MQILPFLLSEIQKRKVEFLGELKNISTKRKSGKTTDEFIVHFNENATVKATEYEAEGTKITMSCLLKDLKKYKEYVIL